MHFYINYWIIVVNVPKIQGFDLSKIKGKIIVITLIECTWLFKVIVKCSWK